MKIRKFLSTVLIAVCVMSQSMPAYAWWGQHSGAGSDYYQTGPAISYDEFKTQINYRETKTLTEPSWRENILNSIGSRPSPTAGSTRFNARRQTSPP